MTFPPWWAALMSTKFDIIDDLKGRQIARHNLGMYGQQQGT